MAAEYAIEAASAALEMIPSDHSSVAALTEIAEEPPPARRQPVVPEAENANPGGGLGMYGRILGTVGLFSVVECVCIQVHMGLPQCAFKRNICCCQLFLA